MKKCDESGRGLPHGERVLYIAVHLMGTGRTERAPKAKCRRLVALRAVVWKAQGCNHDTCCVCVYSNRTIINVAVTSRGEEWRLRWRWSPRDWRRESRDLEEPITATPASLTTTTCHGRD